MRPPIQSTLDRARCHGSMLLPFGLSLGPSLFPAYVILPPPKSSLDKRLPFSCVTVWNAELLINSVLSKHAVQLAYALRTCRLLLTRIR